MRRPLVVVTRAASADDPLGVILTGGGADVVWLPTTSICPPLDPAPLDDAVSRLGRFDWLVFTSGHGVEACVTHPAWTRAWEAAGERRPRVAAVGETTAARLAGLGLPVALVSSQPGAASLVTALVAAEGGSLRGRRVLWPRSEIARREMPDGLRGAGADVAEPVAYRTVPVRPEGLDSFRSSLEAGRVAAVCFLAPSAAEGLADALSSRDLAWLKGRCLVASLGPTTSRALARLGAPPGVEPERTTAEGLAEALLKHLSLPQGASR